MTFVNGGIDLACNDSVHPGGDLNLNGIPYEMADAVVYINLFVFGFPCHWVPCPELIRESDVNRDGIALSVADFVELIRIILGDKFIYHKPAIDKPILTLIRNVHNRQTRWEIMPNADVAAAYLRLVSDDGEVLSEDNIGFEGNRFTVGHIGDTTTMLLYDMELNPVILEGETIAIDVPAGDYRLADIDVVDRFGRTFAIRQLDAIRPDDFTLLQNYPNPFNPSTTIEFFLPKRTDWQLSVINLSGQQVWSAGGRDQGRVIVQWDGTSVDGPVASGTYFYRLRAADQTQTRKMLLLK
ncbi:MAG: T9SS type A sorting domain-containing protein [Candidatus Zixiibacteriota bacterium]